jgi:hypothetical protein
VKEEDAFEEGDARQLGQLLVHDMEGARKQRERGELEEKMRAFGSRNAVLRGARGRYGWLEVMLVECLRNRVHRPNSCKTRLVEFGEEEARRVGKG